MGGGGGGGKPQNIFGTVMPPFRLRICVEKMVSLRFLKN